MSRRGWLAAGVALAAGGGGLWWRLRAAQPSLDVWTLRFERPGGGELAFAPLKGQRLLVNFWATWCAPCVTEMPLLDRFFRDHAGAGWNVVGLAVDQALPVQAFLAKRPVGFDIGLAGVAGVDLTRQLGNPSGALPFTVVFDSDGELIHRKLGILDPAELQSWGKSLA